MNETTTIDRPALYCPPDVDEAFDAWGANCGPAALAASLGMTVNATRGLFAPWKGYASFAVMVNALKLAAAEHVVVRKDFKLLVATTPQTSREWPTRLTLIQWNGKWLNEGVHPGAALTRTHWVAVSNPGGLVYDVNTGAWEAQPLWQVTAGDIMDSIKGCDGTWQVRGTILVRPTAVA